MKQFFEQYGGVALGILALLVLIAMITPVGNIIKTSLQGTVQTFSTKMDGQVDTMTESMESIFISSSEFNGIKNGDLYIDGIRYENLVERSSFTGSYNGQASINGYTITFYGSEGSNYINEMTYTSSGYAYNSGCGKMYLYEDGYDYIVYSSNHNILNRILFDRYDENNIAMGEIFPVSGTYGKFYTVTSNFGRITKKFANEKGVALSWRTVNPSNITSTVNVGVYKIPSNLQFNISDMQILD